MMNSASANAKAVRDTKTGRTKTMIDLIEIRTKVEKAFEGFDFTDKHVGIEYRIGEKNKSLSVVLHDLKADMYVNYTLSILDESTITVIGPDNEAVITSHSHEEVLEAMIKNMKEWGVCYDNI